MQISTPDGTAVTLQPRGWEFPDTLDEDDAQWLVISGHVAIGDRHWTFTYPCLLIGEAHELAGWLRAAADRTLEPTPAPESPEDDGPQLRFLEPLLGFSLAAHTQDEVVVRAYFAHEAAPPWADEAVRFGAGEIVELRVQAEVLTAAAAEWTNHLEALPARR